MENTTTPQSQNANHVNQQSLPNATAVLVLGILSIVTCWCIGIVGLVLGIIAIILSGKANALYLKNPELYTIGSYKNMNAGRVCAIIGTSLSGIYFVFAIVKWLIVGGALIALFSELPWDTL